MTDEDWGASFAKSVAVFLNGQGIPGRDARGQRVLDDSFLLCFNAHYESLEFILPPSEFGDSWRIVVYTGAGEARPSEDLDAAAKLTVEAHAAVVLQAVSADEKG
jgi:isoamylase